MIFVPLKMKFSGNISENTHDTTILMTFLDSLGIKLSWNRYQNQLPITFLSDFMITFLKFLARSTKNHENWVQTAKNEKFFKNFFTFGLIGLKYN